MWPNSLLFWETENENKPQRRETSYRECREMTSSARRPNFTVSPTGRKQEENVHWTGLLWVHSNYYNANSLTSPLQWSRVQTGCETESWTLPDRFLHQWCRWLTLVPEPGGKVAYFPFRTYISLQSQMSSHVFKSSRDTFSQITISLVKREHTSLPKPSWKFNKVSVAMSRSIIIRRLSNKLQHYSRT